MLFHHALPRAWIAVLEGETFCVGAVGQNDGMLALLERAEHVRAHHEAVIHRDRHIPVYAHAVAGFAALGHVSLSPPLRCAPSPQSPAKTGVNALTGGGLARGSKWLTPMSPTPTPPLAPPHKGEG